MALSQVKVTSFGPVVTAETIIGADLGASLLQLGAPTDPPELEPPPFPPLEGVPPPLVGLLPDGGVDGLAEADAEALGSGSIEGDGLADGSSLGEAEGDGLGLSEGSADGEAEGDGSVEGSALGDDDGLTDGSALGLAEGDSLGEALGVASKIVKLLSESSLIEAPPKRP